MSLVITMPIRFSLMLLISALLVSGCSSSSDSSSDDSLFPADVSGVDGDGVTTDEGANGIANEMENPTTSDTTSSSVDESTDDTTGSITGSSALEERSTTRVNFDITVPVIFSDALQVRLVWGDVDTTAMWNNSQFWTASVDFPVNTENTLVVTFSDGNGAITLGSFERTFTTSANQPESLQIAADEFDTDRWDSDGDGVNNLKEAVAGTNPLVAGVPPEAGSIFSAEVISVIFDIAAGKAVAEFSSSVQALVLSTDGSAYPLLSTTPGVNFDDVWTTTSDSRTYECPLFGTVQRSEHQREGWGFMTLLIADNCTDSGQAINGTFQYGRSWASGSEKEFTSGSNAALTINNGMSELVAEYVSQFLPIGVGIDGSYGVGRYFGTNISLTENGVLSYRFGRLNNVESNLSNYIPNVWEIVTSAIDIDEIRNIQSFRKSGSSEFFTSGSFAGNKDGVQVLLIDADTGDENSFSVISTTGDSTISEIYDWSAHTPFNNFPLAE